MATLQTMSGAPLPWDLLKEVNEAWWRGDWRYALTEEPLLTNSSLRRSDVLAIRELLSEYDDVGPVWTQREIADYVGVSRDVVRGIVRGTHASVT